MGKGDRTLTAHHNRFHVTGFDGGVMENLPAFLSQVEKRKFVKMPAVVSAHWGKV
jgi:hypothetical protein